MKIDADKVFNHFPNGLRQVWVSDTDWNDPNRVREDGYQIVDQNGDPVVDELFAGCVYLNETKIEVMQTNRTKMGILEIGKGVDWDVKTPNEIRGEESFAFTQIIQNEFEKMIACCCRYLRILEYIKNRHSDDSRKLERQINATFLHEREHVYDEKTDESVSILECKNCKSEYQWRYRERSIDNLYLIKLANVENVGKPPEEWVPNYLDALYAEIFYWNSKAHRDRKKMYKASRDELISYLFEIEAR